MSIRYRKAHFQDWKSIAQVHIINWKRHYKGLVPQTYLDYEVEEDRNTIWKNRFANLNPLMQTLVGEDESRRIVAFVCTFLDYHEIQGSYLDNLHVLSEYQGNGIGKHLMKLAGQGVHKERPNSKIYLHVLEGNKSAIDFYNKIGGEIIRKYEEDLPWGTKGAVIDFSWPAIQLANL